MPNSTEIVESWVVASLHLAAKVEWLLEHEIQICSQQSNSIYTTKSNAKTDKFSDKCMNIVHTLIKGKHCWLKAKLLCSWYHSLFYMQRGKLKRTKRQAWFCAHYIYHCSIGSGQPAMVDFSWKRNCWLFFFTNPFAFVFIWGNRSFITINK